MADTSLSACHISPSQTLRGPESISAVSKQMPLKSLETALTAFVPGSIMSGMLFLLLTASLFLISPCSCKVRTCVYELLVAKMGECGVLATFPFSITPLGFLFPSPLFMLLFCLLFLFFFHPLPSTAMSRVCSSARQALHALPSLLNKISAKKTPKNREQLFSSLLKQVILCHTDTIPHAPALT